MVPLPELVGNPGNPRFNLKFDNDQKVDLDLYVTDPNGETIYYRYLKARRSQGQLDVDCKCESCPSGPNENIFWPLTVSSPRGKYEFWVKYYNDALDDCKFPEKPTTYTVIVRNDARQASPEIFKFSGVLARKNAESTHWIYDTATDKVTQK
ncbi:hypothetical protein GCM10027341_34920 [Spirosoma knui]